VNADPGSTIVRMQKDADGYVTVWCDFLDDQKTVLLGREKITNIMGFMQDVRKEMPKTRFEIKI
jgi:hypothetical protein